MIKVKALLSDEFVPVDPSRVRVYKVERHLGQPPFLEAFATVDGLEGTYRVAYTNDDGSWQQEGTVDRKVPPRALMDQIGWVPQT